MHLRRVVLQNIKCFSHLELDFLGTDGQPRRWTTILGENGLGKSTILQAIGAALLGPQATQELKPILTDWIRQSAPESHIALKYENHPINWTNPNSPPQTSAPKIETALLDITLSGWLGAAAGSRQDPPKSLADIIYQPDHERGWLACGYGPFRRLSGGSNDAERIMKQGRRSARMVTLFREDAALTDAEAWLVALHNTAREGDEQNRRRLAHVKAAFRENLLPVPAELVTSASAAKLRLAGREPVAFEALSDGYRSMLALGIDLLRWLTQAFPDADEPMRCPGVVLIDELDAHLHPSWQRHIGLWLREKFPNLQFIVATHSPFLAQVADAGGNLVLVEQNGEIVVRQDPTSVAAWQVDQILLTLFGLESTRSPQVEARLLRHEYLLLHQGEEGSVLTASEAKELAALEVWRETLPLALRDPEQRKLASLLSHAVDRLSDQLAEQE